jgi:beta-N-acetylhexosaminidase
MSGGDRSGRRAALGPRLVGFMSIAAIALAAASTLGFAVTVKTIKAVKSTSAKSAVKKTKTTTPTPASVNATVARWMSSLSLRQKIAQLVVIPFNGRPFRPGEAAKFANLISHERVGGMILVNVANGLVVAKADPLQSALFINKMQRLAKIPLLVAGDFERGASMRLTSTTIFPHAMAFAAARDTEGARIEGEITAKESRAMGFQWLFYPDADVNNNPDNPIINIRSYGEDPAIVSELVSAFIEGAHADPDNRVLVTAKHFPGHGDTATDTHLNLATVTADRDRLETLEWTPFRAAIKSGVDSIMTAHLAVPALDDPGLPATLSPKILTGILRDELAFSGLIVTDALDMGGIAKGFTVGDASVRALEAGADVLLMPSDPKAAIDAVEEAVKSGRITKKRIDDSVTRILMAKAHEGLAKSKLVDTKSLSKVVNTPASNAVAQKIADRSVTLVRNDSDIVPLKSSPSTVFYTMIEGPSSIEGQAFSAEVRTRWPQATIIQTDSTMSQAAIDAAFEQGAGAGQYVIAAFASVSAYRGTAALGGKLPGLVQHLTATKTPVVFVALGNPYLLRNFPDIAAYMPMYSTVPPSEVAAVKALFGEIGVAGKLPVSIPGYARLGDGLVLPAAK